MKSIFKLLTVFFAILILVACNEDDNDFTRGATIKVLNAINNVPAVIIKSGDNPITYSTTASKVAFGASKKYTFEANKEREFRIVPESDSLNIIYSELLNLSTGSYSLYLIGSSASEESILLADDFKQFTDSIVGVRFVNLSPNASLLNIGITGEANNTISGLGYKGISGYLEFPAKTADGSYTFEFKDSAGNVLATSTVNPLQNRNVSTKRNLTLAVVGLDDTG